MILSVFPSQSPSKGFPFRETAANHHSTCSKTFRLCANRDHRGAMSNKTLKIKNAPEIGRLKKINESP